MRTVEQLLILGSALLAPVPAFAQSGLPPSAPPPLPPVSFAPLPQAPPPNPPPQAETRFRSDAALNDTGAAPERPAPEASSEAPRARQPFGRKGQWVLLASSNGFGISNETFSASQAKFFNVGGGLGLDSFVGRNFSVGCDIEANHGKNQGYGARDLTKTTSNGFAGGVRLGFNVPFSDSFSWYPRLTLGLSWSHSETELVSSFDGAAPAAASQSRVGPWLNLYAPLLFQPVSHFVLGLGPRWERDFGAERGGPYDGSQTTTVGAEFVVGGWWGGPEPVAQDAEAPPRHEQAPAFGREKQLVLTFATNALVSAFSYSKANASNTSVNLEPGIDYFVMDAVSVGADAFVDHSSGTSLDASGASTEFDDTSIGFAPRFGVNVALGRIVSFWPRLELGYISRDTNQTSGSATNQHSSAIVFVNFSVPLLVQVTSHFFAGAGPSVYHEIADSDQNGFDNDATTLGASALLGGWL